MLALGWKEGEHYVLVERCEQPTEIEFIVNTKTARALGLKIPQSLLIRTDRVVD